MRDLNFIEINKDLKNIINLDQKNVARLNKIIREDSIFLE